jgi:hypothetical protein
LVVEFEYGTNAADIVVLFSAYLHIYLYTEIQPGQFTVCKCENTHNLLEVGMNIIFWVLDLSCLRFYFCFAIGAERSGAEVFVSVWCKFVPAAMT